MPEHHDPPTHLYVDWQSYGACQGMSLEAFFHPAGERRSLRSERIARAKAICVQCPVITQCREYALTTKEPYGIWGGLSENDRARILGVQSLAYPARRMTTTRPRRSPVLAQ